MCACNFRLKRPDQWNPDSTIHHGNEDAEGDIFQAYGDFEHVFLQKCNTAAAAREREAAWEKVAARVNAYV